MTLPVIGALGAAAVFFVVLVRTLARVLGSEFNRIQFTPDLMPADITGTRRRTLIPHDKAEFRIMAQSSLAMGLRGIVPHNAV